MALQDDIHRIERELSDLETEIRRLPYERDRKATEEQQRVRNGFDVQIQSLGREQQLLSSKRDQDAYDAGQRIRQQYDDRIESLRIEIEEMRRRASDMRRIAQQTPVI